MDNKVVAERKILSSRRPGPVRDFDAELSAVVKEAFGEDPTTLICEAEQTKGGPGIRDTSVSSYGHR